MKEAIFNAEVLEVQCQLEGMKATNEQCKIDGFPLFYTGSDFAKLGAKLTKLIEEHKNEQ